MLYFVIGIFVKKPKTLENGFLIINKDEFCYLSNDRTESYLMTDLSDITILYSGFYGRIRTLSYFLTDSGKDNYITFEVKLFLILLLR